MQSLMRLSAVEQARLIRSRQVSATEMVEAGIRAIETLNPALNAVVLTLFERAEVELRKLDRNAPFAGVPDRKSIV